MGYRGLVLVPSAMPRMAMQMLGYAGPPGAMRADGEEVVCVVGRGGDGRTTLVSEKRKR